MNNKHGSVCECRECYTERKHAEAVNKAFEPYGESDLYEEVKTSAEKWLGMKNQDHIETADQAIGGELWVKVGTKPITTYSDKSMSASKAIKTYKPGTLIGTVESYVNNPPMFMTTDNQFVPITGSTFDAAKMDASLAKKKAADKAAVDAKVQARKEENYKNNSLYALGVDAKAAKDKIVDSVGSAISFGSDFIKYGLILALVVVLLTFFMRYSK